MHDTCCEKSDITLTDKGNHTREETDRRVIVLSKYLKPGFPLMRLRRAAGNQYKGFKAVHHLLHVIFRVARPDTASMATQQNADSIANE